MFLLMHSLHIVILLVSTKAVPDGLRAINALIPKIVPYPMSKALAKAAKDQMELETTLQDPRRGNLSSESMLEGHSNDSDLDLDPVEIELPRPESSDNNSEGSQQQKDSDRENEEGEQTGTVEKVRTLKEKRSDGDISLSMLSQRLRAIEAEIGIGLRSRSRGAKDSTSKDEEKPRGTTTTAAGAMERTKTSSSIGSSIRIFWEGVKENVGQGLAGKANKILVAVLVVAVLGSSLAKLGRR